MTSVTTTFPISTSDQNPSVITFALSAPIAVLGTITNALSLSFFVVKLRRNHDNKFPVPKRAEVTTTKLFAALNLSDLFLSVSAILFYVSLKIYHLFPSFLVVSYAIFSMNLFATSFLTCLLAVVRAICVIFPLHEINWILIKIAMALYSVVAATLLSVRVFVPPHFQTITLIVHVARFFIVAALFLVVLISNTVSVGKLFYAESRKKACNATIKKATVTVGIISAIYLVCNIGFLVIAGLPLRSMSTYRNFPIDIIDALVYIALPLNSACNPVVYFIRRSDMRSYLGGLSGKVVRCCWSERDSERIIHV